MTADQRHRVRDLFEAALDRGGAARGWLAAEAADDPAVRDEVLSLFDHHAVAGRFLEDGIDELTTELLVEETAIAPGTKLGAYAIVREVGRGGMGRVYLARDEKLQRQVALKAVAPHLVSDPRQRQRFQREAVAAARLTHPGICTVYALEEIDGALYLVTEFVDGRTLRDEIRTGRRPSAGEIRRTAAELAGALASAHAAGVVHRDLKPENIMRTADGRVKILDFGLAHIEPPDGGLASAVSVPGAVLGTPAYMAPEQMHGGLVDARADIFAFGLVLYEYATGAHPFHGPLTSLGAELTDIDAVVRRCLQQAPADRYASGAELVGALGRGDRTASTTPHAAWWRIHQAVIVALYVGCTVLAWTIKSRVDTPVTLVIFLAIGAASTVGSVLRGHLAFTERVNRDGFVRELRTTRPRVRGIDLLEGALIALGGFAVAGGSAVSAAIAIGLGVGVAVAALVIEPSITAAAFGDLEL